MPRLPTLLLILLPVAAMSADPAVPPNSPLRAALEKSPKSPGPAAVLPPIRDDWSLSAGALWRQIGEVDFQSRHQAGVPDLPGMRAPRGNNNVGRAGSSGSHTYSDGYVYPDVIGGTTTWFWGYENSSQVNGNNLDFHGKIRRGYTSLSAQSYNTDWSDDLAGAGFFVDLESPELLRRGSFALNARIGYSYTEDETSHRSVAFQARQQAILRSTDITDSYDISQIAPVPPAPHNGTFLGPGPIIDNMPSRRSDPSSARVMSETVYTSYLEESLEVKLHTISVGPRLSWCRGHLRLLVEAGFALNIAHWKAGSREELRRDNGQVVREWNDSQSGTEVLPGAYAQLSAEWQMNELWSLFVMGRYDWSRGLSGSVAGSTFDVDLGGWTVGGGVTRKL